MSEITVENLDAPPEVTPEAPEAVAPEAPEAEPEERAPVAFQTTGGAEVSFQAAPKRRGRPKAEPKPKPEPKRRGRPPKPREPTPPPTPVQEAAPPPLDLHALMEPLVQHYIQTSQARRESARRQHYDGLFQTMMSRGRL